MNNQQLYEDLNAIAEAIAEAAGHNVGYTASMDLSLYSTVLILSFSEQQLEENEIDLSVEEEEAQLADLQFLAQNGNLFPESLVHADKKHFKAYLDNHKQEIFAQIRKDCEGHFYEYTGMKFKSKTEKI